MAVEWKIKLIKYPQKKESGAKPNRYVQITSVSIEIICGMFQIKENMY